jgi:hypothetical protein
LRLQFGGLAVLLKRRFAFHSGEITMTQQLERLSTFIVMLLLAVRSRRAP